MATLTMSSHAHAASETMAMQREPRRDPRKRLSAGHTPPPMPAFSFPAAPAVAKPAVTETPQLLLAPLGEPGPEEENDEVIEKPTPSLDMSSGFPSPLLAPSLPAIDTNTPVTPVGGSPVEMQDAQFVTSDKFVPGPLPTFSFGSGSGFDQATSITEVAPRRRHQHKRSTAQSIDISALDLKPRSSDGPRTPGEGSATTSTPLTPHRFTFGPSARMEEAEANSTPPSSRGSSIRFSDPPDLAAFNRPTIRQEAEEAVIDLDMAEAPNPPSPRSRHNRRSSMHSATTRVGTMGVEGHRRTESAPQLAPPIWLQDPMSIRRQSAATSSFFMPMEDVFEEDEGDEPVSLPGMSNSALPSPQTTVGTPRMDTASSSVISVTTTNQSFTSTGEPRVSRRKLFGRKLMFWNSSVSLAPAPRITSSIDLTNARPSSRRRFLPKSWLEKSRKLRTPSDTPQVNSRPQSSQTLPLSGRTRFSLHGAKPSTSGN